MFRFCTNTSCILAYLKITKGSCWNADSKLVCLGWGLGLCMVRKLSDAACVAAQQTTPAYSEVSGSLARCDSILTMPSWKGGRPLPLSPLTRQVSVGSAGCFLAQLVNELVILYSCVGPGPQEMGTQGLMRGRDQASMMYAGKQGLTRKRALYLL